MIIALAILSLIDILCTGYGMKLGVIKELNPLAAWMFQFSIEGTCITFAVLIAIQLAIIAKFMNKIKWVRPAGYMLIGVKLMVVYLHVVWITQIL